ncbi:MAG: crosslink repair DNA glycosylase YcaQ family protein [Myxococcota bacterium]
MLRLLAERRAIQLDPLDPIGTNPDLVAMARLRLRRGDLFRHVYAGRPKGAFEHFAKERCLLPRSAFPAYRAQAVETPWWRLKQRKEKVTPALLDAVEAEIRERGPLGSRDLSDHGQVAPVDWSGWKSTSKAASMALSVLWTQCRVVVAGRRRGGKVFDLPERALGELPAFEGEFARWALGERVEAAGLLGKNQGPCWSMLAAARKTDLAETEVKAGRLEAVHVGRRRYYAPAGFLDRSFREDDDGAMRLLGPLDPLLWDRRLVFDAFGFEYLWEVYKPAAKRRWDWYVMPLLHEGRLVGRLSARREDATLVVTGLWREGRSLDRRALRAMLAEHAEACGLDAVARLPAARPNPPS